MVGHPPRTKLTPSLYFVCPAVFEEVLNYISVFKNQKVFLKTEFPASFENSEDGSCLGRLEESGLWLPADRHELSSLPQSPPGPFTDWSSQPCPDCT